MACARIGLLQAHDRHLHFREMRISSNILLAGSLTADLALRQLLVVLPIIECSTAALGVLHNLERRDWEDRHRRPLLFIPHP